MKLIIAGSRGIFDYRIVRQAVEDSDFEFITEVVSGAAKGVDTLGEEWADEYFIPVKHFPADWDKHGRKAGALRNIEMGDYADALVAIRKDGSRGTTHMIEYMQKLGKPVFVVDI